MKMSSKKISILLAAMLLALSGAFAQEVGDPIPSQIGVDTAQQSLKEISVDKFEDAGFWKVGIGADDGVITHRQFDGGPSEKEPLEDEANSGIIEPDEKVLGVRVDFFKRGHSDFTVKPIRPLPVPGISKTVSVWVAGRNTKHVLKLIIKDHFGNTAELIMGKLNFAGWKQLVVAIPPHIVQRDYHYNNKMGIQIHGFKIECDLEETYGSYYIYFDDLRVVTDLFAEENQDEDDMDDSW